MDHASYLRVLLSVWVGLGLGQLVQAFNRLARFNGHVKWDWLPLVWAVFAFLMVVQVWWAYFRILQAPVWTNFFAFLLPLLTFVVLYLICASALPDVSKLGGSDSVDLAAFHFSQNRYFFGLWTGLLVLALLVNALAGGQVDMLGEDGFRLGAIGSGVVMATSTRRPVHVAVTLTAVGALALYITLFTLTLS